MGCGLLRHAILECLLFLLLGFSPQFESFLGAVNALKRPFEGFCTLKRARGLLANLQATLSMDITGLEVEVELCWPACCHGINYIPDEQTKGKMLMRTNDRLDRA